jgi:hypothetical protein
MKLYNRVVRKPQFPNNFPEKNREFAVMRGKFSGTWERTARFLHKFHLLKIIAVGAVIGFTLAGCETMDYSSPACPRSSGCNAIIYCGEAGCAGYFGGKCNCR